MATPHRAHGFQEHEGLRWWLYPWRVSLLRLWSAGEGLVRPSRFSARYRFQGLCASPPRASAPKYPRRGHRATSFDVRTRPSRAQQSHFECSREGPSRLSGHSRTLHPHGAAHGVSTVSPLVHAHGGSAGCVSACQVKFHGRYVTTTITIIGTYLTGSVTHLFTPASSSNDPRPHP